MGDALGAPPPAAAVEEGELVEMIVYKSRLPQLVYKEDFSVENLAEKVSEFAETLLEKDALLAGPPDPDLEAAKFWLSHFSSPH